MQAQSKIILALVIALICAGIFSANSFALHPGITHTIPKTLHVGNRGKRVAALQWLLSGHDPSHFRALKTYHGKIDGIYDHKTAVAVWNMKYRMGYPLKNLKKPNGYNAGFQLFQLLLGKQIRPIQWIAHGAKRQARIKHAIYEISQCQHRIVSYALTQVGVTEWPWGSNRGPGISYPTSRTHPSFQAVTGAYGAAWCASFSQWVLYKAGRGPIADRSAGVFYIKDWAYRRGLLRSKPEPGTLVLYLWSTGHMGVVVKVTQYGFYTVEGNYANSVARVYHSFLKSAIAFVYLPGCS